MTGPDPSEEQLARIERRVRERIDARVRLPKRIGTAVVAVALLGGAVGLLGPVLHGFAGGTSASSSSAGDSAESAAASGASGPGAVRCYAGTTTDSAFTTTRLRRGESAADAAAACRRAAAQTFGDSASARPVPLTAVTCRSGEVLEVFAAIGAPAAQCARYGLRPVTPTASATAAP